MKQKDRELEHHRDMAQLLLTERDEALATIKKHGLVMDREFTVSVCSYLPAFRLSYSQHIMHWEGIVSDEHS